MPGREDSCRHSALDRNRQLQQANHIGDDRSGSAESIRQFLVGDTELLQQLLVGRRLFERIQLDAVDVLQQRVAQHGVVGGIAHDRRNGFQTGFLTGPPPALAHHQLISRSGGARGAYHDRLHQPEFPDRMYEFGERLFFEDLARLLGIPLDLVGRISRYTAPVGFLGGIGPRCR